MSAPFGFIDDLITQQFSEAETAAAIRSPQPVRNLSEFQAAAGPTPQQFNPVFLPPATRASTLQPTPPPPQAAESGGFLQSLSQGLSLLGLAGGGAGGGLLGGAAALAPSVIGVLQATGVLGGPDGPDPRLQSQREVNRQVANVALAQLGATTQVQAAQTLARVLRERELVGDVDFDGQKVRFKEGQIRKLERVGRPGVLGKGGVDAFLKFTGRSVVVDALLDEAGRSAPVTTATLDTAGQLTGMEDRMTVATSPTAFFNDLASGIGTLGQTAAGIISALNPPQAQRTMAGGFGLSGQGFVAPMLDAPSYPGVGQVPMAQAAPALSGGRKSPPRLVPHSYITPCGNPRTTWYQNVGVPIAFSRDRHHCKRVRKIGRQMLSSGGR